MLGATASKLHAGTEWTSYGVAVLTAGLVWDVVRAPYTVLDRRFDRDTDPEELRREVKALEVGAVFCDPYRPVLYFLVPPGTDRYWPQEVGPAGVGCLGGTLPYVHHVGVPRLDLISPPGLFWAVPPDYGGRVLADPKHLYRVLHERSSEPPKQGEAPGPSQVIA
ncbi:hypothetical protein EDD90_2727 [Streptomyces sp. Ag109_O5-1]|uniref:hypothetical protein n=1 Tax=Streptomyces sp. Ag109_O5-1 TaxID=1938851 RepID=UPI000F4FD04B|nr:hypothetical protein [Streptomyces sp. Ag109_O5-1]RPE39710.1 hypothetical protein EDD90_2727 [Streptomyces sp. Ag109_O5-1]